jgi:UDP-glucose 4-epimerase
MARSRHYTYAGDLATGIVTAMEHPSTVNEDFNLSTTQSTTVTELAAAIWRHNSGERPLALVHDEPFEHDVKRRVPDVDKARRLLGFEATTTLDEVIPWIEHAVADGRL